jgi:hypothetical protein
MKNMGPALAALFVFMLVIGCASANIFGFGGNVQIGSGAVLDLRDPVREAEATRVAIAALDEAKQREIDRQVAQSQADKAAVEAEAARQAQAALVVRNMLWQIGLGIGALVLCVGLAFAAVTWAGKRASSIYPNAAGLYPVIIRRGFGWITFHDPNRGLGPTAVYRTPTVFDVAANAIARLRGSPASALEPVAVFPPSGTESSMLQVASQAQAIGLVTAATRQQRGGAPTSIEEARRLADKVISSQGAAVTRMPQITIINDPAKIADFREMLLEAEQ